jgi:hypothetical protein
MLVFFSDARFILVERIFMRGKDMFGVSDGVPIPLKGVVRVV